MFFHDPANPLGCLFSDSRDGGQVLGRGGEAFFHAAEFLQQTFGAVSADAGKCAKKVDLLFPDGFGFAVVQRSEPAASAPELSRRVKHQFRGFVSIDRAQHENLKNQAQCDQGALECLAFGFPSSKNRDRCLR